MTRRDELWRGTIRSVHMPRGDESANFFLSLFIFIDIHNEFDHIQITSHCRREYCESLPADSGGN